MHVFADIANALAFTPVIATPVMLRFALPLLLTITVIAALVAFAAVVGNTKGVAGVKVTAGAVAAVAIPVSVTLCGLDGALSANCNVAVRIPVAVGVNVMPTVHVALAASAAPLQVFAEIAKSPAFVPVTVAVVMFKVAFPVFCTVTVAAALVVPWGVFGSCTGLVGVMVTAGVAAAKPLPISARVCGLPVASSVIWRVADRGPVPPGVKVTPTMQVALTATVAPVHVSDVAVKSPESVPARLVLVTCRAAEPLLVTVTVIGVLLVCTVVSGKLTPPAGVNPTPGASGPRVQVRMLCVTVRPPVPAPNPA